MLDITENNKILIIDDERLIRRALSRRLVREGYACVEAGNADEALEQMWINRPQLVILDIMMPDKSGDELLPELMSLYPDTAVIMVTATVDINIVIQCMKGGAQDYLTKPFDLENVVQIVAKVLEKKRTELKVKAFQEKLKIELDEQRKQLQTLFLSSIESLVFALEAKDKYTAGHSRRVAQISVAIGVEIEVPSDELDNIHLGALLHDTGKIAIDRNVMNKPGKLTDDEYRQVMTHPSVGAGIVKPIVGQNIIDIILHHHDFYNGAGFEQTVKGKDIPLGARIITIADSFDAMTSDRPYRAAKSVEYGIEEIKRCSGTQFDPEVVSAFLRVRVPDLMILQK